MKGMMYMANITQLPSGTWRARVFCGRDDKGKQIFKSFTSDKRWKVEKAAEEYEKSNKSHLKMTVGEAVKDFIDTRENILSPSSIRGYLVMYNNSIDEIKNIEVDSLTERDLQKWVNNNAAKYAAKSVKSQFSLVCTALRRLKLDIDYSIILLPRVTKSKIAIPTEEQMAKILSIVKGTSIELPVTIALTMGLRQSEIAALKWSDYDGKTLSIHAAKVPDKNSRYVEKQTTKSAASTRVLEVNGICKECLDKAERTGEYISELLPSSVLRKFQKLCVANGLPKFTMHAQRHANASLMLAEGVPDKYAMERLGQSSPNMVKDIYQHTFDTKHKEISKAMTDKFNHIVEDFTE